MKLVQVDANADSDTITYVIPGPQPFYISGAVRPFMITPLLNFPNGVRYYAGLLAFRALCRGIT